MAVSDEMRSYIDGQIDYYISEAGSYRQMAEAYRPEVDSADDAAFGIIAGSVYASFVQAVQSQGGAPSLEDVQELGRVLKERAPLIKKAILDAKAAAAPGGGPGAGGSVAKPT